MKSNNKGTAPGLVRLLLFSTVLVWFAGTGRGLAAAVPISPGPNPQNGVIAVSTVPNTYTFTVGAGQLVLFRALNAAAAFNGNLSCKLKGPAGEIYWDRYFLTRQDRTVLPSAGVYSLEVYAYNPTPTTIGTYSFQLLAVPADKSYSIAIGTTVNEATPGDGSGRISAPGQEQLYVFDAIAGQNVIFEDLSADSSFGGLMSWTLTDPAGSVVFDRYITGSRQPGRLTLAKTGKYRIRAYVYAATSATQIGGYSFRLMPLNADVTYPIAIGTTVADGVPAAGAGRIATVGEQDFYTFVATAGQNVVFEDLGADAAFNGQMAWTVTAPSGAQVFDRYIVGAKLPGRVTLTESGQYRIRAYVYSSTAATQIGTYSFRLTSLAGDLTFPLRLGEVVADGSPTAGAGRIGARGEEDFYTFQGRAGQAVVFEDLQADAEFKGLLAWVLRDPADEKIFDLYLNGGRKPGLITLRQTGRYTLRVYVVGAADSTQVGTYSFRTFIPVEARNDRIATLPGVSTEIRFEKLLFNDSVAAGDSPTISLPAAASTQGGVVTSTLTGVRYVPPAGFQGVDQFTYRLAGTLGGVSTTQVSVYVATDAARFGTVVGMVRGTTNLASLCLQGEPNASYQIETGTDFQTWVPGASFTTDQTGGAVVSLTGVDGVPTLFSRFRKK